MIMKMEVIKPRVILEAGIVFFYVSMYKYNFSYLHSSNIDNVELHM